jgi:molecular chaperone GrpE
MQDLNPAPDAARALDQQPEIIDATAAPAEAAPSLEDSLRESLRLAELKAAEHHDAWLRAKAEADNIRRRAQEDITKASKFAAEKFATAMLPVKDSLESALAVENQSAEKLREGVELTLKQLVSAFDGARLAEENPLGQKFDPNRHQAIGALESDAEPNTVINVLQKGYLLNERVLRAALVMVAKARPAAPAADVPPAQ